MIHFFEVDTEVGEWMFVDLPGYGWARVSRKEREGWQALVEGYLEGSTQLRTAILLQDLRRDFSEDETLLLDWLAERGIDAMVVLTKADKLKPMRRAKRARELRAQLAKPDLPLLLTSSQAKQGIPELWKAIRQRV
jgi:GTP-binding protein